MAVKLDREISFSSPDMTECEVALENGLVLAITLAKDGGGGITVCRVPSTVRAFGISDHVPCQHSDAVSHTGGQYTIE